MFDYRTNNINDSEGDYNNTSVPAQPARMPYEENNHRYSGFINEHPFTKYQWMILALCFITVAMDDLIPRLLVLSPQTSVQEWGLKIRAGPGNERRSGRARRRRADGRAARRSYWPQESADYVDPVFGG